MNFESDLSLLLGKGLKSPYVSTGSIFSLHTESPCMIEKIFNGLAGIVRSDSDLGSYDSAVMFVDYLPEISVMKGTLIRRDTEQEGVEPGEWLVQVEAANIGWQFTFSSEEKPKLSDKIYLLEWSSDGLPAALSMHDDMIAGLQELSGSWLIGSEIEKEAFSRYLLISGQSTLFAPYEDLGAYDRAEACMGSAVGVNAGACKRIRCYPIKWIIEG